MRTRNPTKFLVEKFKADGVNSIIPNASIRFIKAQLNELPEDWQSLEREGLLKRIRETCERGASTGLLKRRRVNYVTGYIYEIVV
jgi:hypothetical protein